LLRIIQLALALDFIHNVTPVDQVDQWITDTSLIACPGPTYRSKSGMTSVAKRFIVSCV
jgi:hypothetical protein